MRALQQRLQPADNVMLNGVDAAPVIPERPILAPPPSQSRTDERPPLQGTALIPPPTPPVQRLAPSVLKGALPPTSDPATWRELP
jgi:general secretion pathway protein D